MAETRVRIPVAVLDSPRVYGALNDLLERMRARTWLTRSGTRYKPSAIRSYSRGRENVASAVRAHSALAA